MYIVNEKTLTLTAMEDWFCLPEDYIVTNILTRLPVKSLLRFKCVAKRWLLTLSDQEFAKSQFKFASEHQTLRPRVLLYSTYSSSGSQSIDLDPSPPSRFGDVSSVRHLTFPEELQQRPVRILAACNGLVCLTVSLPSNFDRSIRSYYLWNPSSGLSRKLPSLNKKSPPSYFGFGYVSATDYYKLLIKFGGEVDVHIFSSRANSWKMIAAPDESFSHHYGGDEGILFNEVLHWPVTVGALEGNCALLVFKLSVEEFRVVPLRYFDMLNTFRLRGPFYVTVVGGCLCVSYSEIVNDHDGHVDVWVLKEYDVSDSWTKLYRLKINNDNLLYSFVLCLQRIFITEKSVLVCGSTSGSGMELIKCETKEEKLVNGMLYKFVDLIDPHTVNQYSASFGDSLKVITYNESLLWP